MGRTDITDEQVVSIFEKYDSDKDGKISFLEYLEMFTHFSESVKSFGRQDTKDEEKAKMEGASGGHHSYSYEERATFARLFNTTLAKDEYVGERFPINPDNEDLWHVLSDGMVLIRLLAVIDKDCIDMRVVNKGKGGVCDIFQTRQNINYGITAAKGKVKLVGVNADSFLEKKPYMLLGVVWQLARLVAI